MECPFISQVQNQNRQKNHVFQRKRMEKLTVQSWTAVNLDL